MTRRKPRGLTAEERALWDKVVKSTEPLAKRPVPGARKTPATGRVTIEMPDSSGSDAAPPEPIPPFRIGQKAGQTAMPAPAAAARPGKPAAMHRKRHARLKRGKTEPEARIDLHGMTLAVAHPALVGFILRAQAEGKRLVLVITGKGRGGDGDDGPIPVRRGVLRQQVPHWLTTPPLAQIVLQVDAAHQRHGGSGAFYVTLRRRA